MKNKPLLKKIMFVICVILVTILLPFCAYHTYSSTHAPEAEKLLDDLHIPFSDTQMQTISLVLTVILVGVVFLHEKL